MGTAIEKADWIVAEIDTLIKNAPVQSSELADDQVVKVKKGEKFFVDEFTQAVNSHWKVKIDDPLFQDDKYIFDSSSSDGSHWLCSWEIDQKEDEPEAPLDVISAEPKDKPIGAGLKPDMPFSTRITPHITYGEFALYQEARRFDYEHQCQTAYELALFLEQARAHFGGKAIKITSGYRPPKINRRVGGARSSEHLFRLPMVGAVDFLVVGKPVLEVQGYCIKHWGASVGKGAKKGFVHLGVRGSKRKKIVWNY